MDKVFDIEIKKLRDNIDHIDRQILDLISQRLTQVQDVVALKKAHNIPVYHPAREEDLISKLRSQATASGIDADFMEEMYRVILRNSRMEQTVEMKQQGIKAGATVLIVGGEGQMGRFFSDLFRASGYIVRTLSEKNWNDVASLCKDADLVLLSVPIHVTLETIQRIAPHISPTTILADLTSIKTAPVDAMLKYFTGPVIGLHPLFGPSCATLDKQIIAVTPGRDNGKCRWLVEQLSLWGAIMVNAEPEEHDDIMDIVQALRHFATFCFGQFLCRKKVNLARSLEFSSPIYRLELGMVGRLFAQDSSLYSEIIFATPSRRKLLKQYVAAMNEQIELVESNDKTLFMERFSEVTQWFGDFGNQAMRESDFIINKLIERF
ncbi:chorismate mutase / prephenate dehydrogenase [Desulfocicer vacuolatum DSM 3385]|uniref:chorismate mutase n=2 Tax=Desulfocicer vacuolatum TaxID=2298 RepID=A0A1W2DFY2_9BACT|nr:chorismate mutase / prephenate dehydrogenase [Desulfocicer vacuolatum DSM 3385]